MSRTAVRTLHAATSTLGLLMIIAFAGSTLIVELTGTHAAILRVKTWIVYALSVLVPLMAVAGGTGRSLAGTSKAPVILRKMRRMKLIGINAALVLVPSAVALYWMAGSGRMDGTFVAVQVLELLAGGVNITLLALNMRDGLRMRDARNRPRQRRAAAPQLTQAR